MFSKRCSRCESKIKNENRFCPSCGLNLKSKYEQEDYGMLGVNDSIFEEQMNFSDNFMEKMINSVMKIFEKQIKNINNEINNPKSNKRQNNPGLNVQFFVNGEKVFSDNEMQNQQPIKITNTISK